VLFIISSDPRVSHRPAEAIRIAAGTGAWARAEVNICLIGPATLMLDEGEETLKDADQFSACLPILREARRPIYVLRETISPIGDPAVQEISLKELSRLAQQHHVVARF
jgi:hypothetical protein